MHRFASTPVPRPVPCRWRQEIRRWAAECRSTEMMSSERRSPEARRFERSFPKIRRLHSDIRVEPLLDDFGLQNC